MDIFKKEKSYNFTIETLREVRPSYITSLAEEKYSSKTFHGYI